MTRPMIALSALLVGAAAPLAALVSATPVAAKSLAYEDNKLNFKNCEGEDVTARWRPEGITLSQAGKSPNEPQATVPFKTWDGACASFGWDGKLGQFVVTQGDKADRSVAVRFVAWDGSLWAAARTGSGFYLARIADQGDPEPTKHFKAAADRVIKSNVMAVPAADILAEELRGANGG